MFKLRNNTIYLIAICTLVILCLSLGAYIVISKKPTPTQTSVSDSLLLQDKEVALQGVTNQESENVQNFIEAFFQQRKECSSASDKMAILNDFTPPTSADEDNDLKYLQGNGTSLPSPLCGSTHLFSYAPIANSIQKITKSGSNFMVYTSELRNGYVDSPPYGNLVKLEDFIYVVTYSNSAYKIVSYHHLVPDQGIVLKYEGLYP